MNTHSTNSRSLYRTLIWILLPTMCACGELQAQAQPASAPASSAPAVAPGVSEVPAANQNREDFDYRMPQRVADALVFDKNEQTVLDATCVDGTNPPSTDLGVPILLKRVIAIPKFNRSEFDLLENPPVRLLRKYGHAEFSFRPIRLDLEVKVVSRFTPVRSPYWDKNKPVWRLDCFSRSTPDPGRNPVTVLIAEDPTLSLGPPDKKQTEDGVELLLYTKSQRMDVAGIFYHNYFGEDRDGRQATYPVVIAWQDREINFGGSSSGSGINDWQLLLVGSAIVLVFFLWLWARRLSKNRGQAELDRQRRIETRGEFVPSQADIDQMDPALLAAAEAFFQEHPEKRPRSHSRPVTKTFNAAGEAVIEVDPALKQAAEEFNKDHRDHGKHSS
jgi:hypothetical protein